MDINEYLDQHLDLELLVTQNELGYLQKLVQDCFKRFKNIDPVRILTALFAKIIKGFDFEANISKKKGKRRLLSELLFQLQCRQFPIQHLRSKKQFEFYLLQLIGSFSSQEIWKELSFTEQVQFIGFCYAFYNEGSYHLLKKCPLNALCEPLEKGFIDNSALWRTFENKSQITEKDVEHFLQRVVEYKEEELEKLTKLLTPLSKDAVRRFVDVFGYYEHQVPVSMLVVQNGTSLVEKLKTLTDQTFKDAILLHIEALTNHPEWYQEGLKNIVHALPTAGKDLSKLAWLETTAKSIFVRNHPIFVFDQSDTKLFQKNNRYIRKLSKKTAVPIVHIGKQEIIELAKKLNVEKLVVTDNKGNFGYGGARNAVFLLAPYLAGKKDPFILMGDDDVYVPCCSIYSDALFAYKHKDDYICRYGYVKGRFAADVNFSFANVMEQPHTLLTQCYWLDAPYPHGMAGILTKWKFCLNLPFGQEENHMLSIPYTFFDFRKPLIHLAGARYPVSAKLPTNRYSGIAVYLKKSFVDIFQRLLVTELLDPSNRFESCALPWNKMQFASFKETLDFLKDPCTAEAMKSQFWKNLKRSVAGFTTKSTTDTITSAEALTEIHEQKKCHKLFGKIVEEIPYYREFSLRATSQGSEAARLLIETSSHKSITELPLTYSLYLVCKAVGDGCVLQLIANAPS